MRIDDLQVSIYHIPTDRPEADGTIAWDSTTMVLVEATGASGLRGLGYSYASAAAAGVIHDHLRPLVVGRDAAEPGRTWEAMVASVRNIGRAGIAASAIAAVDLALWDLRAKELGQPLFRALGAFRDSVPVYGSGGFTTYSDDELREQLGGWVQQGIPRVKMKIGTDWGTRPGEDVRRVRAARDAVGPEAELFVDANGAYHPREALAVAEEFAAAGVTYFEEPVSSDHLEQLAYVRARAPMAIAAGEYGYDPWYFRRMLEAGAVDILQADATRCLGATGFLQAGALAYAFDVPFSAHCAPSLHAHLGCAVPAIAHIEYFHDHARIERMLFDGTLDPVRGEVRPRSDAPGLGLELKRRDAARWQAAA